MKTTNGTHYNLIYSETQTYGRHYRGWYYSFTDTLDTVTNIFKTHWDHTTGPLRDNVIGPFPSEEAAMEDAEFQTTQ